MTDAELLIDRTLEIAVPDAEPVLRNLLITQTYYELSIALARMLGNENANWCTFACWASRTAGRFIRREELPAWFRERLANSGHVQAQLERLDAGLRQVHPQVAVNHEADGLFGIVDRVLDDVTAQIAEGNRIVFLELGTAFARFVRAYGGGAGNMPSIDEFVATFSPGGPLPDSALRDPQTGRLVSQQRGGQGALADAMRYYHKALLERDPRQKAQWMLLANALGGVHEQTRLQTYIAASLNAAIQDTLLSSYQGAVAAQTSEALPAMHGWLSDLVLPLANEVEKLWREVSTDALMELKLPEEIVHLGHSITPPPNETSLYPSDLEMLSLPALREVVTKYGADGMRLPVDGSFEAARISVQALFLRFGFGQPQARYSGAHDWADLEQRMRFIITLFRSRQQVVFLLEPPFDDTQRDELLSGRVPHGPLY
jgi:hypothetical protein